GAQAGYDTDGQVPSSDRLPGSGILRYLSRANVSYLAPVGRGLTLTAGLMNSFIGYESMFAKDNPNYTRSWIADYSPYYLIGAAAQYSFGESVSAGFYVLSDYDYLAYRNNRPKYGSQLIWTISPQWKLTQNLFIGSEQHAAGIGDWRYFSDSIVQWASSDISVALAYDVGTERMSDTAVQALWMGSALFTRWHIDGPWSIALRPEVYWDRDGRLTGSRQLVKAVTATVEYKFPLDTLSVALRGEYRYDRSTGKDGGFFQRPGDHSPLAADQHVLFFSCLVSLDRP
ncbi:MAG: porin, partial [Methylococcaceae bacterium]|nr:porin [Methylococcaceae bacterium]